MNQKVLDNIFLVHYCHPNCKPFQNIMRLPKEKAFALAAGLAKDNPDTTAFYRFADFENYYPRRLKTDEVLYQKFVALGGKPKEKHPLSFVLQGCDYLHEWFENGSVYRIALKNIDSESVSFTFGDSCARYERTGDIQMITKEQLLEMIEKFDCNIEKFMEYIKENYSYIEVQVWDDEAVVNASSLISGYQFMIASLQEKLTIRKFENKDLRDLYNLLSDREVMKYLEEPFDYDKTVSFLHEAALIDNPLIYAVENNNHDFVGYVIYHPYEEDSYEIGWVIDRKHWGEGYANELTKMLITESKGKTKKLIIECTPSQIATKKIADKNGFVYVENSDGLDRYVYIH